MIAPPYAQGTMVFGSSFRVRGKAGLKGRSLRSLLLATVHLMQHACFHNNNGALGADSNVAGTAKASARVIGAFAVKARSDN